MYSKVAERYHTTDDQLCFVYASTEESGGIFGLELASRHPDLVLVEYAPHAVRAMEGRERISGPFEIDFVESPGDGSSHGARWDNLAEYAGQLVQNFKELSDSDVEYHLDGLSNMALEGTKAWGGGWPVIQYGVSEARRDVLTGLKYRQKELYEGLFYIATSFTERDAFSLAV